MKYAAASLVIVGLAAGAAFFGTRATQVPAMPPDRPIEEVIPELVAALAKNGPDQLATMAALGHLGNSQQPSPFSTPPDAGDPVAKQRWEERAEADRQRGERIYGLLRPATPDLMRLAAESDAVIRRQGMWALGAIRADASEVKTMLAAAVSNTGAATLDRQTALIALSRVDPVEARSAIDTILADPSADPGLISAAHSVLRAMGPDAIPQLRTMLRDPDPLRRGYAINALGAMRAAAAPAAGDLAAAITPDLPYRLQQAAVRSLIAIAPDDVATFERVVTTTAFNRMVCGTAGESLARRPGALAFDFQRCSAHQPEPKPQPTAEAVQRALVAAAGGTGDFVVTQSAAGHARGDVYGEATERVIVACVEPRGTPETVRKLSRAQEAAPPISNELRIAAVRVAGDDLVLDSIGGLVDTETPAASCSKVEVDGITDPTRWPIAQISFSTAQPSKNATTFVEWIGQIDPATRLWKMRFPVQLYHLRSDGTMFSDQLRIDQSVTRQVKVIGRFSGIDTTVAARRPELAVRYASMTSGSLYLNLRAMIVPATALSQSRWTQVVMYPMDMSGTRRAKPVVPEGVPIVTLSGALVVPFAPDDPGPKAVFWRKYLTHDHFYVRLAAATALAELKDRQSLPAIVGLLKTPTDVALGAMQAIAPFGSEAVPYLEPLLRDESALVRQNAWTAVGKFGAEATPLIRQALETGPDEQRQFALKALKEIRPSPAASLIPLLVPLLDRCDSPAFSMACWDLLDTIAAAGAGGAAAQPALEQRLQKTTGYQQLRTAAALLAVGGRERAMPVIVEMARTGRDSDAENALRSLVPEIKGDGLQVFVDVLQRRDANSAVTFAAGQIGLLSPAPESAFPVVSALARDADPAVRRRMVPAFKGFRTAAATAQLGVLMRDPDLEVRRLVFPLLVDRGIDAVPLLAPLLDDTANAQRHDLLRHLERLGPQVATVAPAMVARIERLAREDPDKAIQMNAARAVATIRGTK